MTISRDLLECCCCGLSHSCCMPWHHRPADLKHCNCPSMWGSINPPPPCPVHGQALPAQVRC